MDLSLNVMGPPPLKIDFILLFFFQADPNAGFFVRYRPLIAFFVPVIVTHAIWWPYMVINDELSLFTEKDSNGNPYWILSGM